MNYITFRSITYAQRGERVLRSLGLRCTLGRTPRWMEEQGCGYCLRFPEDPAPAGKTLSREGIPFRRVYRQQENGTLEEVEL